MARAIIRAPRHLSATGEETKRIAQGKGIEHTISQVALPVRDEDYIGPANGVVPII